MKQIHLICNAHIDPVWQWNEAEGIGAALSTFRCAAAFCEGYDGFIFNHNEAILYKWVERYDPELFERIKKLVMNGKWHIMGGFELQPDCVMVSGESYVRQILRGKRYFKEKFGVSPTTALNFDSFGHSRGIVQILKKSGYDSYIFMRPEVHKANLPKNFIWKGFDGSEILVTRLTTCYNCLLGQNRKELEEWMSCFEHNDVELYPWGVGNHGGGPSAKDIEDIDELSKSGKYPDYRFIHSTPEQYFSNLSEDNLPIIDKSLYSSNAGCYTSMAEVKQGHRKLENELYTAEKMAAQAAICGLMQYPSEELDKAFETLAFIEFHDVLPGTVIESVKNQMLSKIGYALEIAYQIKYRAFYAMAKGQKKAEENTIPILIYNPHPYKIKKIMSCEYILQNQNWDKNTVTTAEVYSKDGIIPSQLEKEESSIPLDWRKRIIFEAELEPASMNRFDCKLRVEKREDIKTVSDNKDLIFDNGALRISINRNTGLIDEAYHNGINYIKPDFGKLCVYNDNEDPWRMDKDYINEPAGFFTPMSGERLVEYINSTDKNPSNVRIIEDGAVRTVVEALFEYQNSIAVIKYKLPKKGREMEISLELINNEWEKLIKIMFPSSFTKPEILSETAFGLEKSFDDGRELVSHKFNCIMSEKGEKLSIINDSIYGGSFENGVLYKNLLRSPAYCAHPIEDRSVLPQNAYAAHMDNGVYKFEFTVHFGDENDSLRDIALLAQTANEKPVAVSYFPDGKGTKPEPAVTVDGDVIVSALKQSENKDGYILRLYEPVGNTAEFVIRLKRENISFTDTVKPFEIKTYEILNGNITETDLMEKPF